MVEGEGFEPTHPGETDLQSAAVHRLCSPSMFWYPVKVTILGLTIISRVLYLWANRVNSLRLRSSVVAFTYLPIKLKSISSKDTLNNRWVSSLRGVMFGAGERTWTLNLCFTRALHYQLCYSGIFWRSQGVTIPFFMRDRHACVHEHFETRNLVHRMGIEPILPTWKAGVLNR